MRRTQFEMVRSGLGTGILVVALFFQMLPFFLLLVVFAYTLGVTGRGMLVIIPVLLLGMVFSACWLASKRTRHPAGQPAMARRTGNSPQRHPESLLKTRAERYQDLKDVLGRAWR